MQLVRNKRLICTTPQDQRIRAIIWILLGLARTRCVFLCGKIRSPFESLWSRTCGSSLHISVMHYRKIGSSILFWILIKRFLRQAVLENIRMVWSFIILGQAWTDITVLSMGMQITANSIWISGSLKVCHWTLPFVRPGEQLDSNWSFFEFQEDQSSVFQEHYFVPQSIMNASSKFSGAVINFSKAL